ncbi:MAG: dienelactone hydrolase family protein [Planctomycetota bacterium]
MVGQEQETLAPLKNGVAPQTYEELWAEFDPRAEPLEVETLRQWEEDSVVLRVLRFRLGVFKGQRAMLAAVYGFPKGGQMLPGLVQIHGGGQYADYRAPLYNAKRGYATLSISWAGRINAPDYRVTPTEVQLFWHGETDDPGYKLTTDWGAVDGYHAPGRDASKSYPGANPTDWTLDPIESPRNSGWFLGALAARRALTFLERQPEVDPVRLGVYGHSMGGKLTVLTAAADDRVKAAAPSCGGVSDRESRDAAYRATLCDDASLKRIDCPIVFLSPSNDFHGRIDDLQEAASELKNVDWRFTCSAHHNHQDTAEYQVAGPLWFDQHLKGIFQFPATPASSLELSSDDGVPQFSVTPDASRTIAAVDIYYTQHGQPKGEVHDRENTKCRFWRHAAARPSGATWTAELPLFSTDEPLWVYANVLYPLDGAVEGAGYYYSPYTAHAFNLSSRMHAATPDELQARGIRAAAERSLVIETFDDGWQKEWYTYRPKEWARSTHKIYDDCWRAPENSKLALQVRAAEANKLVVGIDGYAAVVELRGEEEWQSVSLSPSEFRDAAGDPLPSWEGAMECRLAAKETLRANGPRRQGSRVLGAKWQGANPEFRDLRWVPDGDVKD